MTDPIKRLDRAFSEAPSELSEAIEQAFKRGEMEMKKRHKLMTTLSIAAGIAVAFAAMGLAAGRLTRITPDRLAVPLTEDNGEYAAVNRQIVTPLEDNIPELAESGDEYAAVNRQTATPRPEIFEFGDETYYATINGIYYHTDEQCSGMKNALPMTADAALTAGKRPCPVCCAEGQQLCWANAQGNYYHIDRECSGMKGAKYCTVAHARAQGQQPCPVCWVDGSENSSVHD